MPGYGRTERLGTDMRCIFLGSQPAAVRPGGGIPGLAGGSLRGGGGGGCGLWGSSPRLAPARCIPGLCLGGHQSVYGY